MSVKRITVRVFQIEPMEDFDLLKDLAVVVVLEKRYSIEPVEDFDLLKDLAVVVVVVLEKRYSIDQQVMIQPLVVALALVQVQMVANYHHDTQEFLLRVRRYRDVLHYYPL
jgi:hypothetical protein